VRVAVHNGPMTPGVVESTQSPVADQDEKDPDNHPRSPKLRALASLNCDLPGVRVQLWSSLTWDS